MTSDQSVATHWRGEMRLATRNTLWTLAVAATALLYAAEMEPRETSKEAAFRMNTSE